jgi:hypothetical protein
MMCISLSIFPIQVRIFRGSRLISGQDHEKLDHLPQMGEVERIESTEQFTQILKANEKVVAEFSATW